MIAKNKEYTEYVESLCNYLIRFVTRTQPMFDIKSKIEEFEKEFNTQWQDGSYLPVGYCDIDRERGRISFLFSIFFEISFSHSLK